jgi:hypothetical protein
MTGILGSANLYKNVPQSIYICNKEGGAVITLNICNRTTLSSYVSVAISDTINSPTNDEWIEYEVEVKTRGVLERSGIVLSQGQVLTIKSNTDNISAVCWGVTSGDVVEVDPITINLGTAPTWITNSSLSDVYSGDSVIIPISVSSVSTISYNVTSGTLPSGLSLNSTSGTISGSIPYTGYTVSGITSTFDVTAIDSAGNSAVRTFTITRRWRDVSTVGLAAKTGMELSAIGKPSGYYYIQPTGQQAYYMYVDNSRFGGGWVLCVRAVNNSQGHWNNDAVNVSGIAGPVPSGALCKVPTSWMQALRNQSNYLGTTPFWMETTGTFTNGQGPLNQFHSRTATLNLSEPANYENARTLCATDYEGPFVDREPNTGSRGFGDHHTGAPYFAYQRHPEEGNNYGFKNDAYGSSSGHLWVK